MPKKIVLPLKTYEKRCEIKAKKNIGQRTVYGVMKNALALGLRDSYPHLPYEAAFNLSMFQTIKLLGIQESISYAGIWKCSEPIMSAAVVTPTMMQAEDEALKKLAVIEELNNRKRVIDIQIETIRKEARDTLDRAAIQNIKATGVPLPHSIVTKTTVVSKEEGKVVAKNT